MHHIRRWGIFSEATLSLRCRRPQKTLGKRGRKPT